MMGTPVGLLQTAHYWANAEVLFGGRIRRGRGTFQKLSYRDETLAQIASHKKKKELIDKEIIIICMCICEKFKKTKILNFHTL